MTTNEPDRLPLGWLTRQIKATLDEMPSWPVWMRKAALMTTNEPYPLTPERTNWQQLCAALRLEIDRRDAEILRLDEVVSTLTQENKRLRGPLCRDTLIPHSQE